MVLRNSTGIARGPAYSGASPESLCLRLRGCHPLRPSFPTRSTDAAFSYSVERCRCSRKVPRPHIRNAGRLARMRFRLFPVRSPLLRESLFCFLLFQLLRCFSSLACLRRTYGFSTRYWNFIPVGCPIRIPQDQRLLTATLRLSRPSASFFGCWCQGIPRVPFVA